MPADCASTFDVLPANEQCKSKTGFHSVLLPKQYVIQGALDAAEASSAAQGFLVGDRNTHHLAGARGEAEAHIGDV